MAAQSDNLTVDALDALTWPFMSNAGRGITAALLNMTVWATLTIMVLYWFGVNFVFIAVLTPLISSTAVFALFFLFKAIRRVRHR